MKRIADSLEILAAAVSMPADPPDPACQHPIDARMSFGQTNGTEDWQCQACGYRTILV